jgi:5'(3')-deoxyribonucleotidase
MKIGVDIDSVLAEAMPLFLKSIEERHGLKLKKGDIKEWNMKWGDIDLYQEICFVLDNKHDDVVNMPLVDGAETGMKYLRKHYDVKLITSRNDSRTAVTKEWAVKNFGDIEIVHTDTDKNGYDIDILIDDAPHHVLSFAKKGGWAIIFDQPWNQKMETEEDMHILRAMNWESVLSAVELIRILKIMERNKTAG